MKLVLATNHLGLGGSESYLLTVAEQLDRLGHEVEIYTPEPEGGVEVAREKGIDVIGEAGLDQDYDAALVQDAGVCAQVADRFPGLPQLFVAHSAKFDLQAPPQLDGVVGIVVVMNDRVGRWIQSHSVGTEVVRLRQPIDTERFASQGALPDAPRTALLLSSNPSGDRLGMLESACAAAEVDLTRLGGAAGQTADVRSALAAADMVIGYGRSILEAMACGRAAYVYDWNGGDGWVTKESYPAIEADGFAGRSGRQVIDFADLGKDLRRYSPSMGPVNHDLVVAHHRASAHAGQLIELLERLAQPSPRPRAPLQEMARLVRLEWRARGDAQALTHENAHLRDLLRESEERVGEAQQAVAREATRVHELAQAFEATASWRLTRPLRALGKVRGRAARRLRALRRGDLRGSTRAGDSGGDATTSAAGLPPPSPGGGQATTPSSRAP